MNVSRLVDVIIEKKGKSIREVVLEGDTSAIKVVHPGLLEIPEGKSFWEMPLAHYIKLAKKLGKAAVMRGLMNLERWNRKRAPSISKKARAIIDKLKGNPEWEAI